MTSLHRVRYTNISKKNLSLFQTQKKQITNVQKPYLVPVANATRPLSEKKKKRVKEKEEVRSMARMGKKRKIGRAKNTSNKLPKSYTILLCELAQRDRVIAMQRDAIEALERRQ